MPRITKSDLKKKIENLEKELSLEKCINRCLEDKLSVEKNNNKLLQKLIDNYEDIDNFLLYKVTGKYFKTVCSPDSYTSKETCPICLEKFMIKYTLFPESDDITIMSCCGVKIHKKCMEEYTQKSDKFDTCLHCRQNPAGYINTKYGSEVIHKEFKKIYNQ
jgi:hypothetical protein